MSEATCWNCRQPLKADVSTCLWCGVAQKASTAFVVAPDAPGQPSAGVATLDQSQPATPTDAMPTRVDPQPSRRTSRARTDTLGPRFDGAAATVGARLGAFTIDAACVAAVGSAVGMSTGSGLLAGITAVETIVLLSVAEARTGATPGNLLLRVRISRSDAPFSPGIGRSAVRGIVTGLGTAAAAVGAWVVAGSGAFDSSGQHRTWADKASGTLGVAVPRRAKTATKAGPAPAPITTVAGPTVTRVGGLATAQPVPTLAAAPNPDADSQSVSRTGAPSPAAHAQAARPSVHAVTPAAGAQRPPSPAATFAGGPPVAPAAPPTIAPAPGISPVPAVAPAPDITPAANATPPVPAAPPRGVLLLVFDTGQREQLPLSAPVNLGRRPAADEAADTLVAVNDPEGTVSKTHLRLEHSRNRTWVTDKGSTNGTDLIDEDGTVTTLDPHQRTEVDDGMRVRIGNRAFTISVLIDSADMGGHA